MTTSERRRVLQVTEQLVAIDAVAQSGDVNGDQLDALGECLASESKVVQRRAAEVLAALARRGVPVEARLLAWVRTADMTQRWGAAFALSLIDALPADAIAVLIDVLGADDADLRWAAAEIVVHKAADPMRLGALLEVLLYGIALQRKMAAYCLRDIAVHRPDIEAALVGCLQDPDAAVRLAAVSALPRVACDPSSVSRHLIGIVRGPDAQLARAAAAALGALGERSDEVLAALGGATASGDPSLQRAAQRSLRLLQPG